MRRLVLLLALVLIAPAAGATPRVQTLLVANGPITAFAQDGRYLAWATTESGRCRATLRIRDVVRGHQTAVSGDTCRFGGPVYRVALARSRALWYRYETGNNTYWTLSTASLESPQERLVAEEVFFSGDDAGVSIFGDGPVLGYAWYHVAQDTSADPSCDFMGTCPWVLEGGGLRRVGVRTDARLRPVLPGVLSATAEGRIAVVVRGRVGARTEQYPDPRQVEVRSASTGALVGSFTTARPIRAIAMTHRIVAVLTDTTIERYLHRGSRLAVDRIPAGSTGLAAGTYGIVYRMGNTVRELERGVIARAASKPIAVSIDGRRVAWAENVRIAGRMRGRIRALTLPG